jgi:hypothetical protein
MNIPVRHSLIAVLSATLLLLLAGCSGQPVGATAAQSSTPRPTPAPTHVTYTSTDFRVPFTVSLPTWLTPFRGPVSEAAGEVIWSESDCNATTAPCQDGADLKLRFISPYSVYEPLNAPEPSTTPRYAAYVAYLKALSALRISDMVSTTVGGRPATLMSVTATETLHGDVGCEQAVYEDSGDCYSFFKGLLARFAVVDAGSKILIIWLRANPTSPGLTAKSADFDQMLTTVRFLSTVGAPA